MRKINSIWFGSKIIGLGLLILLVSFIFYMIHLIAGEEIIKWLYIASLIVSLIVFSALGTVMLIEFCQDKKAKKHFHEIRATRIMISNYRYECQNCGNQNVKLSDKNCNICGIRFKGNTKVKL